MADNKQMKLKIEYDDINKAEKPIQSLVNFFTNNSSLRMLNKSESVEIELNVDLDITINEDKSNWQITDDDAYIELYLSEEYAGFNGLCNLTELTFNQELEQGTDPEISLVSTGISIEGFANLSVKDGMCKISYEDLINALPEEQNSSINDVLSVKVKLTSKTEIEHKWAANIINDSQSDEQIGIASIKYEDKSEGSIDNALVQKENMNPVIDCNTKFVKANTALKFYTIGPEASEGTEFSTVEAEPIGMEEIPVTITPYYDGKENTDGNIIPNFAKDNLDTDEDDRVIQNYKMQLDKDLAVDWKLRTTTFTLQSESTSYDVFYKVGFYPADGSEATEKEVINSLKVYTFTINSDKFTLEYPEWAEYKFSGWQHSHGWPNYHITGKSMWFPVYKYENYDDEKTFAGVMYIELCNSNDGSKFESSVLDDKEYDVFVEFDNNTYYSFYAPLKDYMLDKGNIQSIYYEIPS